MTRLRYSRAHMKWSVNERRFVISYPLHKYGIHLSNLSKYLGPLHNSLLSISRWLQSTLPP